MGAWVVLAYEIQDGLGVATDDATCMPICFVLNLPYEMCLDLGQGEGGGCSLGRAFHLNRDRRYLTPWARRRREVGRVHSVGNGDIMTRGVRPCKRSNNGASVMAQSVMAQATRALC